MFRRLMCLLSLTVLSTCQAPPDFQRVQFLQSLAKKPAKPTNKDGMQIYYGNLHSHTSYSDGILIPREAYRMAEGYGLDFLAVTEHNHAAAGGNDGVWLTPERYEDLKKSAAEFTKPGKFAALYGQEFSTISSGNHVNIFNANSIIDVPNGDFKTLYEQWLPQHPEVAFIQFNHPNYKSDLGLAPNDHGGNQTRSSAQQAQKIAADLAEEQHHQMEAQAEARLFPQSRSKSDSFNDYGYDDYKGNFAAIAQAANPYVRTIEILNGPGTSPKPQPKAEAYMEEDYFFYLNQGFKLAPSADQDNHYAHWGSLHPGRTGVLAKELTPAGIYDAIRARRVFASEDQNLELVLQANGAYMGDIIQASGKVQLNVHLLDRDEPKASYTLQIFADQVGGPTAVPVIQQQIAPGRNQLSFEWQAPAGESYVFAKVTQLNESGSQDDAWTAPIWIQAAKR